MSKDAERYPIIDIAMSRYGHQYGESPKFKQFIKDTLEPIVELQSVFFNLLNIDLDTAKGIKLDLIGRLIGAPSVITNAIPQPFFGYKGQEAALEFGELDDPKAGGYWRESGQPSNIDWLLGSDIYKTVVLAQIIKNASRCTPDDIIKVTRLLLGAAIDFKYIDYPMTIIIAPKQAIGMAQVKLLTQMIPRPSGVELLIVNDQYDDFTLTDDDIKQLLKDKNYPVLN